MAANTSKTTNELKGGDQPLYQPWNDFSGKPQASQSQEDSRDDGPTDSNLDNGGDYTSRLGRTQSATNNLRDAENNALKNNREEPSLYTGQGRNTNDNTKAKGGKKKIGALITILLIIAGGGAFLGSSNSLLLDAVNTLFTNATDYQYASFSKRILRLVGYNMDSDNITVKSWNGVTKYKHMSSSFQNQLAEAGFTFEGSGSKKTMTWTYESPSGGTTVVSDITADEFIRMYNNDVDFRDKYSLAANNRAMAFFDASSNETFKDVGNTRNTFKDFQTTNNSEANTKAYQDTVRPKFDGNTTTLQATNTEDEPVYDEDGNPVMTQDADGNEIQETTKVHDSSSDSATSSSNNIDTNTKARDMIDTVSKSVGDAGNAYCSAMKVGNMISMAIAGNEIYQSIQFFMSLIEPLSKAKQGFGNQSPIHEVLNWFSTKANTSVSNFGTFQVNVNNFNNHTGQTIEALTQTKSPLESNGVQMILGGAPADRATAASFSLERVDKSVTGQLSDLATSGANATNCARFDIGNSIVSIGLTVASGGLTKIFAGLTKKIVFGTIQTLAISAFFSFLVPTLAKTFFTNAFDNAVGQPGGELFARGAGAIGSRDARSNSGHSLGTKEQVLAYNKTTNQVLALDAEVERNRLSPFDTSSPNTFLGSIAYSLLPTLTSSGITNISSLLRSTFTSLSTLISGVHAEGEDSSYMTTFGDCPALESIGAAGDIYCNPITIPDETTADLSPNDETYQEVLADDMNCIDDNCTIKPESDLAKYITYCDGRESPFGVIDQNILGAMQPSGENDIISTTLGQIPLAGDIINIIDSTSDLQNMDWATGAKCSQTGGSEISSLVASTAGNANNRSWWDSKGKYYQRYVEDSRILNIMGAYEATNSRDPVLAYRQEYKQQYLEEHPEADTYIGYLSRISGLTVENTETVLAFVEYYRYLDQYDPSLRIAMDGDTTEAKSGEQVALEIMNEIHDIHFESNNPDTTFTEPIIANHYIIYADTRNRSFAIC